jgi:hypothetical protein
MNNKLKLIGLGAAMSFAGSASAVTPWLIDWPHTVPFGHFLVKITYYDTMYGHTRLTSAPRMQVGYGLTKNMDCSLQADLLDKKTATTNAQGISDAVLRYKYRFFEDKQHDEVAVAGALTAPSAIAKISGKAWAYNPYLTASRPIGNFAVNLQLGEVFPDIKTGRNNTQYGGLLTYSATPDLMFGGELYNTTAPKPKVNQEHAWGFGAALRTSPNVALYARYGHSTEGFSDYNFTAGVQIIFGKLTDTQKKDRNFLLNNVKKS